MKKPRIQTTEEAGYDIEILGLVGDPDVNDTYYRGNDPNAPGVPDQIHHDLRTALNKIRSKLKPGDYQEMEFLADDVRRRYEELIIEAWKLRELSELRRARP